MANAEFTAVACGDDYTPAATITDVFQSSGGIFQVQDQPARYQLQFQRDGQQGSDYWTRERQIGAGGGSIPRGATGIRFRNASPGVIATVSAQLALADEPYLALTFPTAVSVATATRVTSLPVSPQDTQVIVLSVQTGVEWFLIFNASTGYWDFIGGPAIIAQAGTGWRTVANTFGDTNGGVAAPSIVVPFQGEYRSWLWGDAFYQGDGGGGFGNMQARAFNATGNAVLGLGQATWNFSPDPGVGTTLVNSLYHDSVIYAACNKNDIVRGDYLQNRGTSSGMFFQDRGLALLPRRVHI